MKKMVRLGAAAALILAAAAWADDAPATAPAADAGLKVTAQKHAEDRVTMTVVNGETVITVTSQSGIGDLTFERTGDAWPAKIRVIMQYGQGKGYAKLEGLTTLFGVGDGNREVEVQATVAGGVAVISPPKAAEVRKTMRIAWVDFYR
jgi:hypothetical protein